MARIEMTDVSPDLLRQAQSRLRLSDRALASRLHSTEKTWYRWRTEGKVPTTSIPAIARVLNLPELLVLFDAAEPISGTPEEVSRMERRLDRLEALIEQTLREVRGEDGRDGQDGASR